MNKIQKNGVETKPTNYKWNLSINQKALIDSGLSEKIDILDAIVADVLIHFSTSKKCNKLFLDGVIYYNFSYQVVVQQLPCINMSKSTAKRRMKNLKDADILIPHPDNGKGGYAYFAFGEAKEWLNSDKAGSKMTEVKNDPPKVKNDPPYDNFDTCRVKNELGGSSNLTQGGSSNLSHNNNIKNNSTNNKYMRNSENHAGELFNSGSKKIPTFDVFWDAYGLKRGSKKKSKEYWTRLKPQDRIKALEAIELYEADLKKTGISKAYPQKYLNERYFDNEFEEIKKPENNIEAQDAIKEARRLYFEHKSKWKGKWNGAIKIDPIRALKTIRRELGLNNQ